MGLLDDAIREHLELKRLSGADPGEVAREQREALDPRLEEVAASNSEDAATADIDITAQAGGHPDGNDAAGGDDHAGPAAAESTESSDIRQETAELDMRSVLDDSGRASEESAIPDGSADEAPAGDRAAADSLEWDFPSGHAKGALEETPDR